jgi:hypothetical protein
LDLFLQRFNGEFVGLTGNPDWVTLNRLGPTEDLVPFEVEGEVPLRVTAESGDYDMVVRVPSHVPAMIQVRIRSGFVDSVFVDLQPFMLC